MNNYFFDYSQYENKYNFNYYQYKKTINKKNNFTFTLIFLVIILLLGLCVYLAPQAKNTNKFYYVEIDSFQTYKEAISLSNQLQKNGGAGYIYFDNTYHVLVSFYSTQNDAERVVENLINEYANAQVFEIDFPRFSEQKNLSYNQNSSVKNLLEIAQKNILQLELLANNFDTQKVSFNEANILVKNYLNDYSSAYDEFLANFKTNSKFNKAKEYSNNILSSLNNIAKKEEQEFSTLLRYEIINISITFTQITSSF